MTYGNIFVYNFVTMLTGRNLKTITDMRKNADGLLQLAANSKQPVGILKNNQLKAYLIDADTLEALEAWVEELIDRQLVEERLTQAKETDFENWQTFWQTRQLPD